MGATRDGGRWERVTLADFRPLPEGGDQYPLEYIEANSAIKLREDGEGVEIGLCDPTDRELVEHLTHFHGGRVRFVEIDRNELAGYLSDRMSGAAAGPETSAARPSEARCALDRLANDAPIVNLVNSIVIEAIRLQASDIHVECFADGTVVRYRLDGELGTVRRLDGESAPAVSTRIKIMANLNIMERRLPQDGRITVHLGEDTVDIRVSVVPIAGGESFVLRLFNKKRTPLTVDQLGLGPEDQELLLRIAGTPSGLVLVTGPTGSGKTTTLHAIIREIRSDARKIITIEDPIESLIDGVNQIQTNERIGLTFESILRRVLRQDPNIIMVGEIRDAQTAELAIRAALTGHLVFSTLHTKDSVAVVARLRNMGIPTYLIAACLRGSVAQRLVRRLCPDCRREVEPTTAERALLERHGLPPGPLYRGGGCKSCRGSGYRGRMGLFELYRSDAAFEELVASGARDSVIARQLVAAGMKPMLLDGLAKALAGSTTLAEVEKATAG